MPTIWSSWTCPPVVRARLVGCAVRLASQRLGPAEVKAHLLGLWPNDRSGFFEELWFILKTNLGAPNMKLIRL